jgi:hypothetical protein
VKKISSKRRMKKYIIQPIKNKRLEKITTSMRKHSKIYIILLPKEKSTHTTKKLKETNL